MSDKLPKINLTLLKKLVSELEVVLTAAEEISTENDDDRHRFIMEVAKSSGLASGVAQEAAALVKDMYQLVYAAQQPVLSGGDLLDELFGNLQYHDKNRN